MTKEEINAKVENLSEEELMGYARAATRYEYAQKKDIIIRRNIKSRARKALKLGLEPVSITKEARKRKEGE